MKLVDYLKTEDSQSNTSKALSLSIAGILNTILNVVLQMLVARFFSKSELAVYSQSQLVCVTVTAILQVGIPSGIYYFLVRYKDRVRSILSEGLIIVGVTGSAFGVFLLLGGNRILANTFSNSDLTITLLIAVPYILITLLETVAVTLLVFKNRIRFNAIYNVIKALILVLCLIGTVLTCEKGVILFLVRVVVSSTIGILVLILIYKFVVPKDGSKIETESIIDLLIISVPLGLASMAGTLSSNLDNWIVSSLLDPETFSIYHMGAYEIPFIGVITGAIMTVVTVSMNEAVKNRNFNQAVDIFSGVARKTAFFLMPIMVFFFFSADSFICFMYTEQYRAAVLIFRIYLLYIPIRLVTYGPLMIALGKSKALLKREVASLLLNAVVSVVMVKALGAIGACLSTILVTYVFSVPANIYIIVKECKVKWYTVLPFRYIGECIFVSLPGGIVSWIIDYLYFVDMPFLLRFIIMIFIFGIITLIMYMLFFKESIKKLVYEGKENWKNRH